MCSLLGTEKWQIDVFRGKLTVNVWIWPKAFLGRGPDDVGRSETRSAARTIIIISEGSGACPVALLL